MIERGLYVDVWREGFKTKQQANELIAFCNAANITDLFIHMHKDIVSISIDWDYMRYILNNKGSWNVHGWFSGLQLGSNNTWTRSVYDESIRMESRNVLFLDPMVDQARNILKSRIEDFATQYPDAYGIHLDKMRYPTINGVIPGQGNTQQKGNALRGLMQSLRSVLNGYHVSIVIAQAVPESPHYGLCDWQQWKQSGLVDDVTAVIDMLNNDQLQERLDNFVPDYASIVVPCHMFRFAGTIHRIEMIKASGRGYSLFSYGLYAFMDRGRNELARMLRDAG